MIPAPTIVGYLTAASERALPLAIAWHAALAVLLVGFVAGWRPRIRTLAIALAAALLSVALVAAVFGNPFNTVVCLALAGCILAAANRSTAPVDVGWSFWTSVAVMLLGFGWTYPHFLPDGRWIRYAYAAPLGTIPCPTLAAAAGVLLLARNLPRPMLLIVAGAALFYGTFGAVYLGVTVDWVLVGGGLAVLARTALESGTRRALMEARAHSR
jgi:hypothetical protein